MGTNKRYELQIWLKTPSNQIYPIHSRIPPDMRIELTSIREVDKWIDKDDKSIAKAVILDRVNGKVSDIDLRSLTN